MSDDLRYKMLMALSAADLGGPVCEQVAEICAEIAEQHCRQLHVPGTALENVPEVVVPPDARSSR
ncbi:hypothetical protein [Streptomyces sp. NPDC046805]|uniref:hypothetical protein n=1 Tax=Streptomyces sp. NPDC046805 TaxID=3155134 RepID=UPI0033DD9690